MKRVKFDVLKGKIFTSVAGVCNELGEDYLIFYTNDGSGPFKLCHSQDCCESVYIESIVGDLDDLIGSPVLVAEEVFSDDPPPDDGYCNDSYTWTFYKLATVKGWVDIRWFGTSNGYYSETAELIDMEINA